MLKATAISMLLTSLLGCSSPGNTYNDLESPNLITHAPDDHPSHLAIAFSGGGIRGFMHLGVIKALEEEDIHADIVTGTSVGSIAAVLYASGMDYPHMEKAINQVEMSDILDLTLSSRGFIGGERLSDWINSQVEPSDLNQMPIPIGPVVTNLSKQKAMLITKGNPGHAVQTSSSIPGVFIPVEHQGDLLIDGGLLDVVPIDYAREMGADIVIGVDIYCGNQPTPTLDQNGLKTTFSAIRMVACKLSEAQIKGADILIQHNFELQDDSDEAKKTTIEADYVATKAVLPQIKQALLFHQVQHSSI